MYTDRIIKNGYLNENVIFCFFVSFFLCLILAVITQKYIQLYTYKIHAQCF